jgi:uncharacterized protein YndB with AHSA1/START domain
MLQLLRRAALIFVILGVAVFGFATLLPDSFEVSREITIDRPPETVYAVISDLSRWRSWDPWQAKEPALTLSVLKTTGTTTDARWLRQGFEDGKISVQQTDRPHRLNMTLETSREPPRELEFTLQNLGGKCRLKWTVKGKNGLYPLGNIFALQMNKYVGPTYEEALSKLKTYVESQDTATPN